MCNHSTPHREALYPCEAYMSNAPATKTPTLASTCSETISDTPGSAPLPLPWPEDCSELVSATAVPFPNGPSTTREYD